MVNNATQQHGRMHNGRTQGITLWCQLTLLAVCFGKNLTFCSEWQNQVFGNCVSKNKFSLFFFFLHCRCPVGVSPLKEYLELG